MLSSKCLQTNKGSVFCWLRLMTSWVEYFCQKTRPIMISNDTQCDTRIGHWNVLYGCGHIIVTATIYGHIWPVFTLKNPQNPIDCWLLGRILPWVRVVWVRHQWLPSVLHRPLPCQIYVAHSSRLALQVVATRETGHHLGNNWLTWGWQRSGQTRLANRYPRDKW